MAITPEGVKKISELGHKVIIQTLAGKESGYSDEDFLNAGGFIEVEPKAIYQADMVVKVKEPQKEEYELLKENGILFAFLHLPPNPELTNVLKEKKIIGIAYEGIQLKTGERPILRVMSQVAGKTAVLEGIHFLRKEQGGKGILPENAKVVILGGGGIVGKAATQIARALNASVIALDLPGKLPPSSDTSLNYVTEISTPKNIEKAIKSADLVVGAVAIPGGKAEKLVSKKLVASMEPGSVIVDVAIDEGGCVETSRPTNHDNPVFIEQGIIHYCVKNMPGVVPRTSTPALTDTTLPYILKICEKGLKKCVLENPALKKGIHVYQGEITNQKLAETLKEKYTPIEELLQKERAGFVNQTEKEK